EQAGGGEPGQSGGAQQPAGHVVRDEPGDQGEQGRAEEQRAGVRPHQGGGDSGEDSGDAGQEGGFGVRGQDGHAGEFQSLARDGQDEEGDQPGQQARDVETAQPQQRRADRRDRARGLGEQGGTGLTAPEA